MGRHRFDQRRRDRQEAAMLQMIDDTREQGLHVAPAWRVPIDKGRPAGLVRRGGARADRRAQRHADGARAAERAALAARSRTPEARAVRELATFLIGLSADRAALLAAVDRALAKASGEGWTR